MYDPTNTLNIYDIGRKKKPIEPTDLVPMNIMFDLKCESSSGEEEETEGGEASLTAQVSRCANVTSADLDELEHNRNESSTVKQTIWAVNCFKAWLREKQLTIDLKTAEKSELNPVLREFYGSIRTSKGELYGISSYVGLRAGLNRFINEPPINRAWNLMQDTEFRSANNVFKGVVKQMRRSGRDITAHYPPISPEDKHMLKHSAALDPGNPKGLLNKVWYDIQLHFGLRGKEGNRHLQPDAFALNRDQNGFKYFTMTLNEDTKNPQERDKKKRKAMFEEPGNPLCPVASLEKYLSKIPADAKALYLQPKRMYVISDEIWYTAVPLGVNYLSQMLPKICKEAGTRTTYTNHSLRVTSIQRLTETREIMAVCLHSVPVEINTQWQQESAPFSPSSELDSSSAKQESPVSSHSWVKQEPEPEVVQWENMNSEAATGAEQDKSLSSAVAADPNPMEDLPSGVRLTITKLQCLLESKQERIEALERQVQDLQEDRRFLRSQIENLTGARLVPVPEASTSVFSAPRSRKRRRKSSSSSYATDESSSSSSSEESSSVRKKRRHKKKGKRVYVSQCD
ncbi:zinc finger MYM-type protein 2 isoform X2 [Rhinichthys klamathensis goyatoka]|uniref:zinc finger MYM-type protein 2 isoform X2 n=1 Tax=Rhinichthys klamathensis goyatoka TaxID=3034132 RepID=UPI0024B58AD8|nr:zinc finger MYM-type protein 2 isoform X2 [Rhinichthys klamathensis goyatoka]